MEEIRSPEGDQQHGRHRVRGAEEGWEVRDSGRLHGQDAVEAGHKGWKERGLREGGHGESQACQDGREGVCREGPEGWILRMLWKVRRCLSRKLHLPTAVRRHLAGQMC